MNYTTVDLTIDREEARSRIGERVSGISRRTVDGADEYRTSSGYHLATLSDTTLPNGERGSQLKYRTAIVAPFAAHARTKARQIHKAVASSQYK